MHGVAYNNSSFISLLAAFPALSSHPLCCPWRFAGPSLPSGCQGDCQGFPDADAPSWLPAIPLPETQPTFRFPSPRFPSFALLPAQELSSLLSTSGSAAAGGEGICCACRVGSAASEPSESSASHLAFFFLGFLLSLFDSDPS